MRRVYLDVCALCRPFDDQTLTRIRLETLAVELILNHVRQQQIELIVSPAHDAELGAITETEERTQLIALLNQIGFRPVWDLVSARQRATDLSARGFGLGDAAHVALAELSNADFVTVDDRLMKKCDREKLGIWFGTPVAYCEKERLK